jgi:hypothetical protein
MIEQHTVEVTFEAEEISSVANEDSTLKLYRTPENTYLVYIDMRGSLGNQAVLDDGRAGLGHSEAFARDFWPELFSTQSAR